MMLHSFWPCRAQDEAWIKLHGPVMSFLRCVTRIKDSPKCHMSDPS